MFSRNLRAKLWRSCPTRIEKVGVFVDASAQGVADVADKVGLTAVQLYVNEGRRLEKQTTSSKVFLSMSADLVKFTPDGKGPVWGSFWALPENLAGICVDSGTSSQPGGTGRPFDWEEASAFVAAMGKLYPMVVAGGLTSANVVEAMDILKPWGVDVSSGVESKPGKKDPEKVRAFIKAVRDMDAKYGPGMSVDSSLRSE